MRILIVGNLGMLGTDLMAEACARHDTRGVDRQDLDITDPSACLDYLESFRPEVVINAAALTQVDYCETHEDEAFRINAEGAGNLAEAASAVGARLVHFSTDYIFDGTKSGAYVEEDRPNPRSVYGRSKLAGEELIRARGHDHLILRTSWLFGRNGANFIRTILGAAESGQSLRVVDDQKGSPTYTPDLSAQALRMIESGCRGVYNVTNSGSCTWYRLAVSVLEWAGLEEVEVVPVTTAEFPRPAPRPANSVLANARLAMEGFPLLRPWQQAAREYVTLL